MKSNAFALALAVAALGQPAYGVSNLLKNGVPLCRADLQPHTAAQSSSSTPPPAPAYTPAPAPAPAPAVAPAAAKPAPAPAVNTPAAKLAVSSAPPAPSAPSASASNAPVEALELPSIPAIPLPLVPTTFAQAPSVAQPASDPASSPASASYTAPAPVITPPPSSGGGSHPDPDPNSMTIAVINNWAKPLSISFGNNAGGPQPLGNPQPTQLPSSTQWVFPTGWAGRMLVGPGPDIDQQGSLIEGSFTGRPDIDVSYVDGYSVPITCSANGQVVSGCNIDLFAQGLQCDSMHNGICYNSARESPDGPAPAFFQACAGAAYTFPNDNDANNGDCGTTYIECCIGTSCPPSARQGKAKRDVQSPLAVQPADDAAAAAAAATPTAAAAAPVLRPQHRRHIHRHAYHLHAHKHI